MLTNIDFSPGKITYNDFDINLIHALTKEHIADEKDLLQVQYPNNILIDVEWKTNSFIICIIKDFDWENPVVKKECKDLTELEKILKECVIKIRDMLKP